MRKKSTPKTQEQINEEIATLKEIKPRVRRFTAFGDDNWKQIELQIRVLEEGLDESDIEDWDQEDNSAAYEAIQWRDGEAEEGLSDGWKELVR